MKTLSTDPVIADLQIRWVRMDALIREIRASLTEEIRRNNEALPPALRDSYTGPGRWSW